MFFYEEVPMAFRQSGVNRIKALTIRFAPLLRTFGKQVEVDWEFYAQACTEYQFLMNRILLALGVCTFQADENLQIVLKKDSMCRSFMPRALNRRLYFHKSRFEDAFSYIKFSSEIFIRRGVSINPHELKAIQVMLHNRVFNPNTVKAEIVVTNEFSFAG